MKSVFTIAALSLVLMSSCQKDDYTCVCNDSTNTRGVRKFEIENKTQRVAVEECKVNETELNASTNSYSCHIE